MEPGVYRYELTVPAAAVDGNGHVNNVEYLRWMLEAAVRHSDQRGSTQAVRDLGAAWVVRTHHLEYLRPAFAGERLAVLTWVAEFRKVRSRRRYRIFRVADGALLAEGETLWVLIDSSSGRPRSIPEAITRLFTLVPEAAEPKQLDPACTS